MSPKSFPHTGWARCSDLCWDDQHHSWFTVWQSSGSNSALSTRTVGWGQRIFYISPKGWLSRNMLGGTAKETFHRRLQLLSLHPWPQGSVAFCSLAVHLQWWVLVAELTFPQVCVFPVFHLQSPLKHPGWLRKEAEGQITALSLSPSALLIITTSCVQAASKAVYETVNNNPITSTRPRYKDFTCINALSILSHRLIQRWLSLASLQRNDEKAQEQLGT